MPLQHQTSELCADGAVDDTSDHLVP